MGFSLSDWDQKLLRYGLDFEEQVMNLTVNIPLFEALDLCWGLLAQHFEPEETGIRRSLIEAHWPEKAQRAA